MIKDIAILTPLYVTAFWGVVFITNFSKSKPKFLLGIFMIVAFVLYLTHIFFFDRNALAYFHTESLYILTSLSVYPLYYWYIKILTVETTFRLKNLVHFFPAIIFGLASLISGLFITAEERPDYFELFAIQRDNSENIIFSPAGFKNAIFIVSRFIFIFQVFYYLIKGSMLTQQHERRIANFYSNAEGKTMLWVRLVTISFLATAVTSITFSFIGRTLFLQNQILLPVPSIIFSSLLFLIGYLGNITNHVIVLSHDHHPQTKGTVSQNSQAMTEKILNLFKDDKIYKNPDLSISNLSDALHTPGTDISQLINDEFKTDFSNFVNQYRIVLSKSLILNNKDNILSLEKIAAESGFSSLNAFTRVFKSYEGMTPQKFRVISDLKGSPQNKEVHHP